MRRSHGALGSSAQPGSWAEPAAPVGMGHNVLPASQLVPGSPASLDHLFRYQKCLASPET